MMWGRPTLCLLQLGAQSSDKSLETDCQDFKGRVPPPAGAPRCRQGKKENGMIKGGMHLACLYFLTSPSHMHLDLVKL